MAAKIHLRTFDGLFLTYSRSRREVFLSATILNLYCLLDDLEAMFFSMADNKGIRLDFERDPKVPQFIRADEVKLMQVLTNLLSIALESTSQGNVLLRTNTIVRPTLGAADLRLTFTIEDTGPGMAVQGIHEVSDSSISGGTGLCVPESRIGLTFSTNYVHFGRRL